MTLDIRIQSLDMRNEITFYIGPEWLKRQEANLVRRLAESPGQR